MLFMSEKITLPKNHFSWSQYSLWRSSRSQYIARYIQGKEYRNKYMDFGKEFAELQATKKPKDSEKRFTIEIDNIEVLGFFDRLENNKIIEHKTGSAPWTQRRVDNHGQLTLYAAMYLSRYGELPEIELEWHETEVQPDGSISLTGRVEVYRRIVTMTQIRELLEDMRLAIKEISDYMKNQNEIIIEAERYAELEAKIKELKTEQAELKPVIEKKVKEVYDSDAGKFYYTIRKKYEYPKEVIELEQKYKQAKKQAEKNSKYTETKTLTFRSK